MCSHTMAIDRQCLLPFDGFYVFPLGDSTMPHAIRRHNEITAANFVLNYINICVRLPGYGRRSWVAKVGFYLGMGKQ